MKRADHGELISLVYSLGLEDDCFFWSGIPGWQQELYELEPRLRQKLNISSRRSVAENERAKRGDQSGEEEDTAAEKLAALVAQLDERKAEFGESLFNVEVSLADFVPGLLEACHERGVLCMQVHTQSAAASGCQTRSERLLAWQGHALPAGEGPRRLREDRGGWSRHGELRSRRSVHRSSKGGC